jgi:hypothetical protein
MELLPMIEACQQQCGLSTRRFSAALGLNPARLGRWRAHVRAGRWPLGQGGPQKTAPLPLAELVAAITGLEHGARRTHGTGALYRRFQAAISRRELAALIAEERTALHRAQRQRWHRVCWPVVNVAWSIDGVEWPADRRGHRLWLHPVQELCSRFRFPPLVSCGENGEAIARHLTRMFDVHGAPLFLKRDNGSALNDAAINAVLAVHAVLPLNSPVHYPRYNGAMENGIGEARRLLRWLQYAPPRWQPDALAPYVRAAYQEMNYRPRRCLAGRCAAEVYHESPRRRFSRAERQAALEWIARRACVIFHHRRSRGRRSFDAAWRQAAESWLRCQGLITVAINPKVSPNYPEKKYQQ